MSEQGPDEARTERIRPVTPPTTRPLPTVGPDSRYPVSRSEGPTPRVVRMLVTTAGLLSAGMVLLGLGLLLMRFVVPALRDGAGLNASTGPSIGAIIAHLVVGGIGEGSRHLRWTSWRVKAVISALVICAVFGTLWWSWWA